jgi:hypothetical protein
MRNTWLVSVFVCALAAQAFGQQPADLFSKAPPAIDEALRDRISKYMQLQVDGKPRLAEQYVAEDSKDYYYEMRKPRYLSFAIGNITYSDEFTKAKAMITVEMYVDMIGLQGKPMKVPFMTWWKVADGQWYWYVEPQAANVTPFGKMNPGPVKPDGAPPALPPDPRKAINVGALQKQVRADKRTARLKVREASSDQITISSEFAGTVSLQLQPIDFPGLAVKLDRTELKTGEKAVLSFHFEPGANVPRHSLLTGITVQPINSLIALRVLFE